MRGDRCKYDHPQEALGREAGPRQNGSSSWGGSERSTAGAWRSRVDAERNVAESTLGEGNAKGGGKGKRKGKSWGDGLPRHVNISKTLSQILRHKAPTLGIEIDAAGFCKTKDILEARWLRELNCTMEDIEKVVQESDKKRFEAHFDESGVHVIRAVQGHSLKTLDDELAHERLEEDAEDLPKLCVHGTYHRYIASILESGLKPGGTDGSAFRKHVHFAPFEPGDKRVISGMRYDTEVGIWIDLRRAMQAGIPFYISPNQVILSPGKNDLIPVEFFDKVVDLRTKKRIWPK